VYLPGMLNNLNKNIKTYVKQILNFHSIINAKTAIYFGLAAYWGIILFGTFFNI
tara:strand:+ start:44 stop:205 length:162 start_codon:yes stop_codon:yes gene_type:complete